jgi:four helix bundle protein
VGNTREQRGFEDLECYKLAVQVLKESYSLARQLPDIEKHNLSDQMRRSAVSATLNIAEGYGRYHYLESLRFFYYARGSLMETLSAFVSCEAVGYIDQDKLTQLRQLAHSTLRALNGYIRYVRRQQQGHKEYGTQLLREDQPAHTIIPDDLTGA